MKRIVCEDLLSEWATHHTSELIIVMGVHSGHVGRKIDRFQGVNGGLVLVKEIKRKG